MIAFRRIALSSRPALLVCVDDPSGLSGWGEASPLPGYSPDTLDACVDALRRLGAGEDVDLSEVPSARFALETAALDLEARRAQLSIAALLGGRTLPRVRRGGMIDAPNLEEARRLLARGLRTIKVKIGRRGLDQELEELRALRRELGDELILRLDANGAWGLDEARSALERLAEVRPELVEEPVCGETLLSLGACAVPWAADESLADHELARALLDDPNCAAFVLKPALLGGLGPARDLAEGALARGKSVVVTHMRDGAIATAAACELALSLSSPPLACGLDLHAEMAEPIPHLAVDGFVVPSGSSGLGVEP